MTDFNSSSESNKTSTSKSKSGSKVQILIGLITVSAIATVAYMWKSSKDHKTKLLQNRIIAEKLIKPDLPLPDNYDEEINLQLLQQSADNGNENAKAVIKLIKSKLAAKLIILGKPSSSGSLDKDILETLEKEASNGNHASTLKLKLYHNRILISSEYQPGRPFPEDFLNQLDFEILEQDASAGNYNAQDLLSIIESRKHSEALCVLGKPFDFTFYDHVDRKALQKDANAGYLTAQKIIKLADNRIKANELTILTTPYQKDFFDHVDRDLLKKDADAGNADSMYVYARLHDHYMGFLDDPKIQIEYYRKGMKKNHAPSISNLGSSYSNGKGVDKDDIKAYQLFKKAAELDYTLAKYILSTKYRDGIGTERNPERYRKWIQEAAEEGYIRAQSNLGFGLFYGHYELERDELAGLKWIKQSANKECKYGMAHLASIYRYGLGGETKDLKKAEELFLKSANKLNTFAIDSYVSILTQRMSYKKTKTIMYPIYERASLAGIDKYMARYGSVMMSYKDANGKRRKQEGLKWIKKGADAGHIDAYTSLADLYRTGGTIKKDTVKAVKYHTLAAEKGNVTSMTNLGNIYGSGRDEVKQDVELSFKFYKMAADLDYPRACYRIAYSYMNGKGTDVDHKLAHENLNKALENDYKYAYFTAGAWHMEGKGIEQNTAKGLEFLEKAISKGDAQANRYIGYLYEFGENVKKNESKALNYYQIAADKKEAIALNRLGKAYENGELGQTKSLDKAIDYYQRAHELKYERATKSLKRLNVLDSKKTKNKKDKKKKSDKKKDKKKKKK